MVSEVDQNTAVSLLSGIEDTLKGLEPEVADIDAVAAFEALDVVEPGSDTDQIGVISLATFQLVVSRTSEKQIAAATPNKPIVAGVADEAIMSDGPGEMIVTGIAKNQVTPRGCIAQILLRHSAAPCFRKPPADGIGHASAGSWIPSNGMRNVRDDGGRAANLADLCEEQLSEA